MGLSCCLCCGAWCLAPFRLAYRSVMSVVHFFQRSPLLLELLLESGATAALCVAVALVFYLRYKVVHFYLKLALILVWAVHWLYRSHQQLLRYCRTYNIDELVVASLFR